MENIKLDKCFGCGKQNPLGLHLDITYVENKSHIEFTVDANHCGYPGILHGGIIAALFDEAMFYAVKRLGIVTMTISLSIEYLSPGLEGHKLVCEALVEGREGRKVEVLAEIKDADSGKLVAKARGGFLEVNPEKVLHKQ